MAQNFIACDRDQQLLLPPDMREWLAEDHLAWFVIGAAAEMDLGEFYAAYREDGRGRPAFEPRMMVALLLYAYAIGVRSARGIERRCREDIAFRVITDNECPDHSTIARFREGHETAINGLFGEVLELCAVGGLVKVGVIAVDGTKIAAAATHHQNRSYEEIAREILEEAAAIDAAEDELYGDARGDELPPELATGEGRRAWLREAKRRLEEKREREPTPVPRSRPKRLRESKRRLEEELWTEQRANEAYEAYRARGRMKDGRRFSRRPDPYQPPQIPAGKINVTDPDSRNLKTTRGWVQGYNAQAVVTAEQIVIAAEISTDSLDTANLLPMIQTARAELQAVGVSQTPGIALADAGYWKNDAIEALVAQGIQTVVAPDADRRKEPRPGRRGGLYDFTRRVLATESGKQLYLKRQGMIEPVFGQIKSNRGANRFLRRGRSAVRSEWRLLATTHNLLKLHRHQLAAA
jgi:transposase